MALLPSYDELEVNTFLATAKWCIRCGCHRCQAAPDGSGKSLFNLRAWGQGLFNNLRLGFAEQKEAADSQPGAAEQQQQSSAGESRNSGMDSSNGQQGAELQILQPMTGQETSWEDWLQVTIYDMNIASQRNGVGLNVPVSAQIR